MKLGHLPLYRVIINFCHLTLTPLLWVLACKDSSAYCLFVGAWGIVRSGLGYLLWFLICWELFLSSCVSFGSLVVSFLTSPVVGGESFLQSQVRFASLCKSSTISSWELLKTIPQYTPQHIQVKDKMAKNLQEHSFFYRVFYFILH